MQPPCPQPPLPEMGLGSSRWGLTPSSLPFWEKQWTGLPEFSFWKKLHPSLTPVLTL